MSSETALYASAPGVMISSPGALAQLEPGVDHQRQHEAEHGTAHDLFGTHRLVCLGTGSPQLYYDFVVHERPPSAAERTGAVAFESFDLEVLAGGLVIRDGYDLLEWEPVTEYQRTFPLEAGSYHVTALFVRVDAADEGMRIALFFASTNDELEGSGWPYLEYVVPDDE